MIFKVASSTWAMHFLKMNGMSLQHSHQVVSDKFGPLTGQQRKRFLKTGKTFLVVRDPFERLVSAYLV